MRALGDDIEVAARYRRPGGCGAACSHPGLTGDKIGACTRAARVPGLGERGASLTGKVRNARPGPCDLHAGIVPGAGLPGPGTR